MPLEIAGHTKPHFEAKMSGKCEPREPRHDITFILCQATVVCIGNFTPRPGRKMSAVVGWVNVKDWSIPHLKALTVTFKLM